MWEKFKKAMVDVFGGVVSFVKDLGVDWVYVSGKVVEAVGTQIQTNSASYLLVLCPNLSAQRLEIVQKVLGKKVIVVIRDPRSISRTFETHMHSYLRDRGVDAYLENDASNANIILTRHFNVLAKDIEMVLLGTAVYQQTPSGTPMCMYTLDLWDVKGGAIIATFNS